jgi:AraC family transcriptional regulator of adaptative response/methylated-DNA-[protein]-cysteine methyltransferase
MMTVLPAPQTALYDALCRRDPAFEGRFFYAVRTTGVYCRPTCTSRRPRAENVEFFESGEAARAAGYRACKRCRPDEATSDAARSRMLAVCAILDAAESPPSLAELGRRVGLSPSHLQRTFTRVVGVSPKAYAEGVRDRRLRDGLRESANVTSAVYDAGYGSHAAGYADATARLGTTPGNFRAGGVGLTIGFGIFESALGRVLVATTPRGICAVRLGGDDVALERELRSEFPRATIERADDDVASAASAIVAYLAGTGPWPTLPLDVRATAFQARVWDALRKIAPGTTATYGELARALGDENASRAVARACATNPVALLVPCHRVVPKAGGVGGYRWGVERKGALLRVEREGSLGDDARRAS